MVSRSFIPYGRQDIDGDDIAAVTAAMQSDFLTTGPLVRRFEAAFEEAAQAPHAVVCNSGTAALHLAALAMGLGPGDLVLVPAVTFLASANAMVMTGAEVAFVDVDPLTGRITLDQAQKTYEETGQRAKAIVPVYLGGDPTDPALYAWAKSKGMTVIADACHALGGWMTDDKSPIGACLYEDIATFSLHPVKAVAMGEGGMVTCTDDVLARRMRKLRSHGMERDPAHFEKSGEEDGSPMPWYYEMDELGYNYRAPDILCALGLSQLSKLPRFHQRRAALADRYDQALQDLDCLTLVPRASYATSGWHLYRVVLDFDKLGKSRTHVMTALRDKGIGTQVHYIPVNDQPYYRHRHGSQPLPGATAYYLRTLSLPLYSALSDADQDFVIANLFEILS